MSAERANDLLPTAGLDENSAAVIQVSLVDKSMKYEPAKSFEGIGLKKVLLQGIQKMKFEKPSAIQGKSLPLVLPASASGCYTNLIAQGHNGSGKTACFALAMLNRVDEGLNETQALCLVHTRELARQIGDVVGKIGSYANMTTHLAIPESEHERKDRMESGGKRPSKIKSHIVIGTPGTVTELLKKKNLNSSYVKIFVVDEADHMVNKQGMGDKTVMIKRQLPENVQVLLFSATYAEDMRRMAKEVAPGANELHYEKENVTIDNVKQYFLHAESSETRFDVVNEIYDLLQLGQTIVFVRTRANARNLTAKLRENGQTVSIITGGEMDKSERDRVIDEFRAGTTRVLVTTDVLARGVDVPAVTAVINYDMPRNAEGAADCETYIHRCGRAGRFGRRGIAINLVHDVPSRKKIDELAKFYGKSIEEVDDVEDLEERVRKL